jgi:prevent-host-death family protein
MPTELPNIQLRDAKAHLSQVVDRAENGEASVITRHGKPAAVVLGYEEWLRLSQVPSFGWLLMNSPLQEGDIPERDQSPPRDVEF